MEFNKKVYGYDPTEVNNYISKLISSYESELDKKKDRLTELVEENRTMRSQLELLSQQIDRYKQHEESVGSAIIRAEEAAKQTLAEAERKRLAETEKISADVRRWEIRCGEVRHELADFEDEIIRLLEKYQSEVSYLASKDIKKTYFSTDEEKNPGKTA